MAGRAIERGGGLRSTWRDPGLESGADRTSWWLRKPRNGRGKRRSMRVPQRGGGSRCTRRELGADAGAGRLKRRLGRPTRWRLRRR